MKRHTVFIQIADYSNLSHSKNVLNLRSFDDYIVHFAYNSSYDQIGDMIFSKQSPQNRIYLSFGEEIRFYLQNAECTLNGRKKVFSFIEDTFIKSANDYGVILLTLVLK